MRPPEYWLSVIKDLEFWEERHSSGRMYQRAEVEVLVGALHDLCKFTKMALHDLKVLRGLTEAEAEALAAVKMLEDDDCQDRPLSTLPDLFGIVLPQLRSLTEELALRGTEGLPN